MTFQFNNYRQAEVGATWADSACGLNQSATSACITKVMNYLNSLATLGVYRDDITITQPSNCREWCQFLSSVEDPHFGITQGANCGQWSGFFLSGIRSCGA
jgi:hypothetical protein